MRLAEVVSRSSIGGRSLIERIRRSPITPALHGLNRGRSLPRLTEPVARSLAETFAPDVAELERLTGRSLEGW